MSHFKPFLSTEDPSEKPYFILLESCWEGEERSVVAAWEPRIVLEAKGENFFEEFRHRLHETRSQKGRWIGYLGYELYSELEPKVARREPELLPKAVFCFYENFHRYDIEPALPSPSPPRTGKAGCFGSNSGENPDSPPNPHRGNISAECGDVTDRESKTSCGVGLSSDFSRENYLSAVRKIKSRIAAGDCYQVNLSQKFTVPVSESAYDIYRRLRRISPAPYSAFLNLGEAQILSSSPECFLQVDGRRVITRPIKGTRPRGKNDIEDASLKEELATSAKDRAELLMITDLERNDLGRVCRPGSVRVSELARVETYPQVHHLVSTVEGELAEGRDIVDLLKAAFPGGSITGAPKVRAMQIIRELEPRARDVYCGAIGYVDTDGSARFNVAIRTMVVKNGEAHFWGGGGIVADSEPEKEYEETLTKVKGMVEALS